MTEISRQRIGEAVEAWRDGATYDAIHPLERKNFLDLWDPDAVKDLARVIAHVLQGDEVPVRKLPWS